MSTVRVDEIRSAYQEDPIAISDLKYRVIKTYRNIYTGGRWDASDSYAWMPGAYVDYTPASGSSRIRFLYSHAMGHINGHAIGHWIMYRNGTELGRHSVSGQSPEHRHQYIWDMASWGTTSGRIGYQVRRYGGSNRPSFNTNHHWNGSGSQYQNCYGQLVLEEYFPI